MPSYCVVLNTLHDTHVTEFAERCSGDPDNRAVLQYAKIGQFKSIKKLITATSPVPIFLIGGGYKDRISASGLLWAVEFRQDMSPAQLSDTRAQVSKTDDLFGSAFLHLSDVALSRRPIPITSFIKRNNSEPLKPGRWLTSICHVSSANESSNLTLASGSMELAGFEGSVRYAMRRHLHRESALRKAKIDSVRAKGLPICCSVAGCGFDYGAVYGVVGKDYIHVHHLKPLGTRAEASATKLEDLALVCSSCHAMIHMNAESRSLDEIARMIGAQRRGITTACS